MAFTIKIYEKNEYIFALLKKRLSSFYPDAYIIDPYIDKGEPDDRFSNYTCVLYDPKDITEDDISHYTSTPLRLTDDGGIVDCAKLISLIMPNKDVPLSIPTATGSLSAVIPFVYSDVRDRFISDLQNGLKGADYNIRLDFTSKLRALWRGSSGSNMTALLEACQSRKFVPEDILKYCNMDDSGFLTPGSTKNFDDVYDLGISRSTKLMYHAADLAHSKIRSVNVLAVVEGFRTMDLPELLASCDKVSILLPARSVGEDIGARELISLLTRTLGRERIAVYYAEDLHTTDEKTDPAVCGRMAV